MIWSIRLHMQTMKTPLKNRIFARLAGGRLYSDLTATIVAGWHRSDMTAVGASPQRVAAVMAQGPIPVKCAHPYRKRATKARRSRGREADTPKAEWVPRLASVAPCFAQPQ